MAEAAKKSTNRFKKWPRKARGGGAKVCGVKDCKRPYRAKGYCFFHYKKWRHAELPHSRYRTCSKADCRMKVVKGGLCAKHIDEAKKASETAAPAAAPAAPAAPAA